MIDLVPYDQILEAFEQVWGKHFTAPLNTGAYREAASLAKSILENLASQREVFVSLTLGLMRDARLGDSLDFSKRILGTPGAELPASVRQMIARQNQSALDLGLLIHLIGQTFPNRHRHDVVDVEFLFHEWLPKALIADLELDQYDQINQRLPSRFFDHWFEDSVAEGLKPKIGLRFWKRKKAASLLRSYYFAGIGLGLNLDLATSRH